ncbi:MAG: GAF domain-containing protein [Anaerolineae bacterium]|nr:GAF domain-containing protein [Anaerolineae bacterium]
MESINPTVLFIGVEGLAYLVILSLTLKRRGFAEWPVRLLVIYLATASLWCVGQAIARLDGVDAAPPHLSWTILTLGLPVLAFLFLLLTRFVLRLEGEGWGWWIAGALWLGAMAVLGFNLLHLPDTIEWGNGWAVQYDVLAFTFVPVLGWGSFMGGATTLTLLAYRRIRQPLHRNRIKYWALALGATIAGAATALLGQPALGGSFYLLGTFAAAYVLFTYHLPDVRQMARGLGSTLTSALLAAVVYTTGFLLTLYAFQNVPGYTPLLAGLTLALVLVLLFDPILRRVRQVVDRLFFARRYDSGQTLREYSASISNILDLERLGTVAVGLLSEALDIRNGSLFVVHYAQDDEDSIVFHLRSVGGMGPEVPSGRLSAASPVADYLLRRHRPLTQYDVDLTPAFQDVPKAERKWLQDMDMDVYVPIYAQGEWIGLLALGPKASGDRYFESDLELLSTLADQTAVALENARLFDDVKARSVEIELLNDELTTANRELARLDQAKTDFIGVASHELRTPLTNIRGYNDILHGMIESDSLQKETALELTQGVGKGVQRLHEIVNTMFDVSRIDTATLDINPLPTPVAPMIKAAINGLTEALAERKQRLTTEGLEELPTMIVDNKRIEQVFNELIQNAIKFTPDGGHIWIGGRLLNAELPPPEQEIEFIVADEGIGIAVEDKERIFQKFYRVGELMLHSTSKTKFKGAGPGLGLTVVKGIVETHGGRIWVESPGHDEENCPGSAFHILLPVLARVSKTCSSEGVAAARAGMEH